MKAGLLVAGGIFLLAGVAGWQWRVHQADPERNRRARMDLTWTGNSFGTRNLPVEITWCPGQRLAILMANDSTETGILLAFRVADSLAPGQYRIRAPEDSLGPRPWVVAALRHVPDSMPTTIERFAGRTGEVTLTGGDAQEVAGSFSISMRWPGADDTVLVRGSFSNTPVVARSAGCS